MKHLGTGVLLVLVAALLVFSARTLRQLERLGDHVEALEARVKAPPPRLAAPPPAVVPDVVREAPAAPPPALEAVAPETTAIESTGLVLSGRSLRGTKKSRPLTVDQLGLELTPEQKKVLEGVLDARRREQLQIEGDAAFRLRELERRYDAQIRSWLNEEQRKRFDESRPAPRLDGPLTDQAQDYLRRDPAPYDLEVEWGGTWWPARTKDVRGELTLIHYVGHGDEWHEWVGPERVRPRR